MGPAYVELLPRRSNRSKRWREIRGRGVTASEIAAVVGVSPYESAWSLWMRKKGHLPERPDSEWMRWGRVLEPTILREFCRHHREFTPWRPGLCASVVRPWQLCSVDMALYEGAGAEVVALAEAKADDSRDGWGDPGTGDIPEEYRAQVLWQIDVFAVEQVFVPVLFRGKDYQEYVIERDAEVEADIAFMRAEAQAFLRLLAEDEPPPIDEHDATTAGLHTLHEGDPVDVRVAIPAELAETYRWARENLQAAETDLNGATNEILALLGDAKRAVDPDGEPVATRVVYDRRSIATEDLRRDMPEVAAKYERTSRVHQLRAPQKRKRLR